MKKIISIMLTLVTLLSLTVFTGAVDSKDGKLSFSENGKFKIIVFSDCQDDVYPSGYMTTYMDKVVKFEKPDLAIFLGDNIVEDTKEDFIAGITPVVETVSKNGVPFAYVYGNHDDEYGVSKEEQYEIYKSLGNCLTYDADPSITGFGTCNLPIYSSDGSGIAFNLWLFDSNTYIDEAHSKYDGVREDQIEWYKATNAALNEQAGKTVNSMVFQHIPVREINNLLESDPDSTVYYKGKQQTKKPKEGVEGYFGKIPAPSSKNYGEFEALKEAGNTLAIVNGHDHINTIKGNYQGIDIVEAPGMSYRSFGDDHARGCLIIEIDENDTSKYTSRPFLYNEYAIGAIAGNQKAKTDGKHIVSKNFISDVSSAAAKTPEEAKSKLTEKGFTVIDKNLNDGVGGDYVYMGYKTSTDYKDAITDIRFYSHKSKTFETGTYLKVNDTDCYYKRVGDDLNSGVGGTYIYIFYSRNASAGKAITAIDFANSYKSSDRVCTKMLSSTARVELNEAVTDNGREKIYCILTSADSYSDCSHMCHSNNSFISGLWKIVNAINKLFHIDQHCKCGIKHW